MVIINEMLHVAVHAGYHQSTHPYLSACIAALINYAAGFFVACFMLRVDPIIRIFCLIVTIVEIHMLFLDVYVRLSKAIDERFFCTKHF